MIFTMNSQSLLEGLNVVTRALAPRATKQILEGVYISAEKNRVKMICSDGALSIIYTDDAAIEEEGQTVLPGRLFNELIRKMPDGNVKISINDRRMVSIRCRQNRSNLSAMNPDEYPSIAMMRTGAVVKIPQKKLKDMISHVNFAVATDENRVILTGSLMEVSRDEARMVSLDGFRLSLQRVSQPFEDLSDEEIIKAVIPGKVLTELGRILGDDESFCSILIHQGRMQCTFGNICLISSLLNGEYIDYRKIIPREFKTEARVSRVQLEEAIERAGLMAREGKNNLIRMSFRDQSLLVCSKAEMGDVEEEIDVDLQGEPIDIAFNARYITDVVRNVVQDEMIMKFNTSVSPCVIFPKSGEDYLYLILPVRVFQ